MVYLLKKAPKIGFVVLEVLIVIQIVISILICWKYDLKAGPLALENYYMFSYLMYKPYSKLAFMSMGIQFGYLYHNILIYRLSTNKPLEYPRLHSLHTSSYTSPLLNLTGVGLIITCLFCGYEALKDPYAWPLWKNFLYFAFVRIAYVLGTFLLLTSIFLGTFNSGLRCLSN